MLVVSVTHTPGVLHVIQISPGLCCSLVLTSQFPSTMVLVFINTTSSTGLRPSSTTTTTTTTTTTYLSTDTPMYRVFVSTGYGALTRYFCAINFVNISLMANPIDFSTSSSTIIYFPFCTMQFCWCHFLTNLFTIIFTILAVSVPLLHYTNIFPVSTIIWFFWLRSTSVLLGFYSASMLGTTTIPILVSRQSFTHMLISACPHQLIPTISTPTFSVRQFRPTLAPTVRIRD